MTADMREQKTEEAYRTYIQDQAELKRSGKDFKMLNNIFKTVGKVDLVALVDTHAVLQTKTDYRGHRKFLRTACEGLSCVDPAPISKYRGWLHHVLNTVFRALKASDLQVSQFKTEFGDLTDAVGVCQFSLGSKRFEVLRCAKFRTITSLYLELLSEDMLPFQNGIMHRAGTMFPNVTDVWLRFSRHIGEDLKGAAAMGVELLQALKLEKVTRFTLIDFVGSTLR